jgi:hypothetical protein
MKIYTPCFKGPISVSQKSQRAHAFLNVYRDHGATITLEQALQGVLKRSYKNSALKRCVTVNIQKNSS